MGHRNDVAFENTEGDEAIFTVGESGILDGDGVPAKTFSAPTKSMPCFRRFAFRFASSHSNRTSA